MSDIGEMLGRSIAGMFMTAIAVAFALGGFAFWAIPKAWGLIKPWIHQVTS